MSDDRPVRGCDLCRQVDDHPRHVMGVPAGTPGAVPADDVIDAMVTAGLDGRGLREQLDPTTVVRHIDCCANAGCMDGSCIQVLAAADGKTHDALSRHLEAQTRKLDKERG